MKIKKLLAGITVLLSLNANAVSLERFLEVIKKVESSGNVNAVGDSGKALGPYQIHKGYFEDAKNFYKNKSNNQLANKQHKDCFDENVAKQVVLAYLERYAKDDIKSGNWEALARKHNGGPNGDKKEATKAYWNKIKKELEK